MQTQLHSLSTIWSAVVRRCPLPVGMCLFRTTEGRHAEKVRIHGTDRHGLDRPEGCTAPPWTAVEWARFGYEGPWRPFVDVIYASTAADVRASLAGEGSSALIKIPTTDAPHVIIYRAADFVAVKPGQYAFVNPAARTEAVVDVFAVEEIAPERIGGQS